MVLTTHYLEEAEQLCDRIAIINHGKLIADKPTRELVEMAREKIVVLTLDREVAMLPASATFIKCVSAGERVLRSPITRTAPMPVKSWLRCRRKDLRLSM